MRLFSLQLVTPRLFLPSVVLSCLLLSQAFSQAQAAVLNWWNDPKVIAVITLTDEQRQKIDTLVQESVKKRGEINRKLAPLQRTIPDLLSQPELDEQKLLNTLATQDELQSARRREVVLMRMQVRKVLTAEQFKRLLALSPNIMRQQWATFSIPMEVQGSVTPVPSGTIPSDKEKDEDELP